MRAQSLMVLGTSSGVGKSFIAAGLCRLFSDWKYRTAPFKSQNMSNNSYVTAEGGEMGRAQAVQAECARVRPHTDMNPVLLKPSADNNSQVVVHGKVFGQMKAREYFSRQEELWNAVCGSYERLASVHDVIIIEGAGSPAEVNLKPNDFVNMKTAVMADASCLLVADIDRGGVFASLLGTLELLEPSERQRIRGLIINKFRGDLSLFEDGVRYLEQKTGKPVLGVLPYERNLWIEEEDALSAENYFANPETTATGIDIAVVLLPRLSNFTDFEVLRREPGVRLRYVRGTRDFGRPDLVIIPGTKATLPDLAYLKDSGLFETVERFAQEGGRLLGICGGFQMFGREIVDPEGLESGFQSGQGWGFFNMTTRFEPEKILMRVSECVETELFGYPVKACVDAYEIHSGRSAFGETYPAFGKCGSVHPGGRIAGTYFHGLFDHGEFRRVFLDALAASCGKERPRQNCEGIQTLTDLKEKQYNALGNLLARHLNVKLLRQWAGEPQPVSI